MPYKYNWLLESHIIEVHLYGDVTVDELTVLFSNLRDEFLEGSSHPIHIMLEVSKITSIPHSLKKVKEAVSPIHAHEHSGWTVFINIKNPLFRMLVNIVAQLNKRRIREVKTIEEALELLYQVDTSLPEKAHKASD